MMNGLQGEDKDAAAIFPLHPRESLWGGRHTPAEQRLIREWIKRHPLETDGRTQRNLWAYCGNRKRQLDADKATTCKHETATTESDGAIGSDPGAPDTKTVLSQEENQYRTRQRRPPSFPPHDDRWRQDAKHRLYLLFLKMNGERIETCLGLF